MTHNGIAEAGINSLRAGWVAEADRDSAKWNGRARLLKSAGRRHLASNAEHAAQKLSDLARNYRQGA